MKWSKSLIPTMKESPSDAEIKSHELMLRAGYIRKLGSGLYTYLPLGVRALHKVQNIIREEMDKSGAQEVFMPAMQPKELWEESGRFGALGDDMMIVKDRHGREVIMGPTHEEVITDLVRKEIKSYKQLPLNLYQIQTKFRDEIRPRYGVMRSREFIMKDAYSFHENMQSLQEEYDNMHATYCRIMTRCGLPYTPVEADTGAMGGASSHEFMIPSEVGEDTIALCNECGYSANLEKASASPLPVKKSGLLDMEEVHTPDVKSIEDVSAFLKLQTDDLAKTMLFSNGTEIIAVVLRGDHEVSETKLATVIGASDFVLAEAHEIETATGGAVGFSGPVGLKIKIIADLALKDIDAITVGANKKDYHLKNCNLERDCNIDTWADIRQVVEGDCCPKCQNKLQLIKGIEAGHIFQLGTKYSESMGANILDSQGKSKPLIMGCYGIGVNRLLAAAIENGCDENGISLPLSLAPFQVVITTLKIKDEKAKEASLKLYEQLQANGVEVLWDDRDMRPGFKFKDADLIGVPIRVNIGGKSLADGEFELAIRKDGSSKRIAMDTALETVLTALN